MANIKINAKIYQQDINKDFSTLGIKFPMNSTRSSSHNQLFNMSYTTEEQAVSNYINLLLTKPGERYMQPNFGVGLWWHVFEQNSLQNNFLLENKIREQAGIWLPYIINHDIQVGAELVEQLDANLRIQITFSVGEHGANRIMSVFTNIAQEMEIGVN